MITINRKNPTAGEITSSLTGATDGTGLHFDGAAGLIDIASPPDLGTKFSFEFIVQADSIKSSGYNYIVDFGNGGRFALASINGDLAIYDTGTRTFGTSFLDDLKVHHLVVTVDGTSAIAYDNGNQVGTATLGATPNIDSCSDAVIGEGSDLAGNYFDGTLYRTRFWNKTLTAAEVTASYENATVPFADQYGSQTEMIDNGTFTGGTSGWALNGTAAYGTNDVDFTGDSSGDNWIRNTFTTAGTYQKNYLLTYEVTANTLAGAGASLKFGSGGSVLYPSSEDITSTVGTHEFEFVSNNPTGSQNQLYLILNASATGGSLTLDNVSLKAKGVVADYDCAFSNPQMSLTVQDRSTNGVDGTASATGVVQVTPIEQLNSKSARIGTSAATPADGTIVVDGQVLVNAGALAAPSFAFSADTNTGISRPTADAVNIVTGGSERMRIDSAGNVGIGGTPEAKLGIIDTGLNALADVGEHANYHAFIQGSTTNDHGSGIGFGGVADVGSAIISKRVGSNYKSDLLFYTKDSTVSTADPKLRLTISSAGLVSVTKAGSAELRVTNSSDTKNLLLVSGTASSTAYISTLTSGEDLRLQANGGLTTAVGGIVEQNGVLKSNLLTNSGFDVWSNSTLEVALNKVTNGNFDSGDTGWTKNTGWTIVDQGGGDYEAVATNNEAWIYQPAGVTAGKLYRVTVTCSNYTDGSVAAFMYGGAPVTTKYGNTLTGIGTSTLVWEAVNTSIYIGAATTTAGSDLRVDDITFEEVTPGCVAADGLAFDGWEKDSTLDIWRQHDDSGTYTKDGSFYALKTTSSAASDWLGFPNAAGLGNNAEWFQRFAGRTVTFGAWVKTSTASHCCVQLYDGGLTSSSYHTGGGAWEWLEVTKTISSTPTYFIAYVRFTVTATDAYVSQPMLVFGNAIGAGNYSRPSGEIVNCEKFIRTQSNVSPAAADDKVLNLEALSSGKIPKGCKAVNVSAQVVNSSITSDQGVRWGPDSTYNYTLHCNPVVNNVYQDATGVVACDSNGDIYQQVREADATLSGLYQDVTQVHLR